MDVTTDELYQICNALNSHAKELERDAISSRRKGHTFQQIAVVEQEVSALRALSKRLIDEKNEDETEPDDERTREAMGLPPLYHDDSPSIDTSFHDTEMNV